MDFEVQVFKALSDKTRLRIMILLTGGELCVCDLEEILGETQSKISRHLTYLKNSGLVTSRREGVWMHYAVKESDLPFISAIIATLTGCFKDNPEVMEDARKLEKNLALKESGRTCR